MLRVSYEWLYFGNVRKYSETIFEVYHAIFCSYHDYNIFYNFTGLQSLYFWSIHLIFKGKEKKTTMKTTRSRCTPTHPNNFSSFSRPWCSRCTSSASNRPLWDAASWTNTSSSLLSWIWRRFAPAPALQCRTWSLIRIR